MMMLSKMMLLCRYSMLKIALGAEFNSEKMFRDVARLASKYRGVQLHTHVAENPVSTATTCIGLHCLGCKCFGPMWPHGLQK